MMLHVAAAVQNRSMCSKLAGKNSSRQAAWAPVRLPAAEVGPSGAGAKLFD